jgi:uncharacterized protein (TIGR00661 family)
MDLLGKSVLNFYAPASLKFGYHFLPYNTHIFSPVIRKEIRSLSKKNDGQYSVYLPAYSAELIIKILIYFPSIHWHVFSKDCMEEYNVGNIRIRPIQNEAFIKSMAASEGVLSGAGFQTPAEVLFLNKKLMVVPMRGQYEQQCNAAALEKLGVPILKNLKFRQVEKIKKWIENETVLSISFPDETQELVNTVLAAATSISSFNDLEKDKCYTLKKRISRKIFQLKLNN